MRTKKATVVRVYSYKRGARGPQVAAQIVGEALEAIERRNGGRVTPQLIVAAARAEDTVLHAVFEWDDTVAGELYRESQAGSLVRAVNVKYLGGPEQEPRRAYISVVVGDDKPAYLARLTVLGDPELRSQAEQKALQEIDGWQRRYEELREDSEVLQPIFEGIEVALTRA
jgi:hypothetical protein